MDIGKAVFTFVKNFFVSYVIGTGEDEFVTLRSRYKSFVCKFWEKFTRIGRSPSRERIQIVDDFVITFLRESNAVITEFIIAIRRIFNRD